MKKKILLLIFFYSINNFCQNIEKPEDNYIYNLAGIEVKPTFPEGLEKLYSYINLNQPKVGSDGKLNSNAAVMFIVEKDGSLNDIKIYGKAGSIKLDELIKALRSLPKWNPGKQNGITVRVSYVLPLIFI